MILKLPSLPIHERPGLQSKPLKSEKGSGDFESMVQGLLNPAQEKFYHGPKTTSQAALSSKKASSYLEALRKGLLAKGKPLDRISIRVEELHLLEQFLEYCGFSKQVIAKFLKGLIENNPGQEISLSEFFAKIGELDQPKRKASQAITLGPSAIPHVESALRHLGLTPKEADSALRTSRIEGGNLDLGRLVTKLKEIQGQIGRKIPFTKDKDSAQDISIKDLINALEQMTRKSDGGDHIPSEVKSTIDKISNRVVITPDEHGPNSRLVSLSKLELARQASNENISKASEQVEKEVQGSPTKGGPHVISRANLVSNLDGIHTTHKGNEEEGAWVKWGTRAVNVLNDATSSPFSETIHALKQGEKPLRDSLPTYLANHVGSQIARSILRGERVIRLQLKPPELGVVKVKMDVKDNILKLGMITENSSVKELLLSNVRDLREALVEQGVKLERVDIQISDPYGQSLGHLKENRRDGQSWTQERNVPPFIMEAETKDPLTLARAIVNSNRLLDLVA